MGYLTPPISTKGRYSLKAPYQTTPGVVYTCVASSLIQALENTGIDVFELCYNPKGLTQSDYMTDKALGVVILTLASEELAPLYVPNNYLLAMPDVNSIPYHHVVMSLSLGPVATTLDLINAQMAAAAAVSDVIGIEPEVHLGVMPLSKAFTPEEHEIFEIAREAKINNRDTNYSRVLDLERQLETARQQNVILTKIVKDKGLLP